MSYVSLWIHAVFSTKYREPVLNKETRVAICSHIKEYGKEKGLFIDRVGGYSDHLHVLFALGKSQNIAYVMQQIKGESAHWANEQRLTYRKLQWQDDYYAVSVSRSHVERVRRYIARQEEHHRIGTFAEEVDEFMQSYGRQQLKG